MERPESSLPPSNCAQVGIKCKFVWLEGHDWLCSIVLYLQLLLGWEHDCFVGLMVVYLTYYVVHKGFCCRCEGCSFSDVGFSGFQGMQVQP